MNDLSAALFAPVEGVDVEEVLLLINERITLNRARTSGTDRSSKTAARIAQIGATLLASTPALAREVERLRAEAADMQRAHSETLDYLLEQRAALAKRVLILEEERDAWRRAANVAPVTQCGACGAALLPQPRDNGVYPCACGATERVTTFATPSTALDVARLKAELDTETRRHEAATTRLSAIHDELLSMTGSSPAIADPPNVWRQFVSELADLADEGKALPLFQRLVERTAAALSLDKERQDPETGEPYLPSWHDIPEQVSKLREENARLLAIADACQHWSTRALRAEAALEEHLDSLKETPCPV